VRERLLVIGGDAGGMAAASQARRLRPDLEIIALEKGHWTSYSACGIPYLIGGEIKTVEELVARTPAQFRDGFDIDVRLRREATSVDLDRREVEVLDVDDGTTSRLGFDLLMFGTGARPRTPDIPGIHLPAVHGIQTLDDAPTCWPTPSAAAPDGSWSSAPATSASSWPRPSPTGGPRSPSWSAGPR
jgi:NADPH-dependent 2,4-dienoyl-CoA reductase/sulfur reductase-like enzyme